MGQSIRHQAIVAVVGVIVLFSNLGGPRLWDRDEPRNAGCAAEMLQRGDWVVPVFNAELRAHKPVLLYWLMMTAYALFGVNEFAARFWSAVLAVGTSLATYQIGRRLFNAEVGLWSGIILATSLMFDVAGRAATPDSALIFFSTLALVIYVRGAFQPGALQFTPSWPQAALMYAVMGLAVLAKGPVGLVLPTAVIGMFLLVMRLPSRRTEETDSRWYRGTLVGMLRPFAPRHFLQTCWSMRPLTALAAASAVALPWYLWVGLRTDGEFLRVFFLEHHLGRAASPMEGHRGSLLYYPVAILVGFFPWSVFAAPTLIDAAARLRQDNPWRPGYVLASCWVGVWIALFSIAQTKLPSYVTPCYPALAMLTGCFIYHWRRGEAAASRWWPRLAFGSLALVGAAILIALPFVAERYLPGEGWLATVGLVPLVGAGIGLLLMETGRIRAASTAFAAMAVVFTTALFGFAVLCVDRHQQNQVLLAAIERYGQNPRVGALGRLEPSWVFYGGRPIVELSLDPSERTNDSAGPGTRARSWKRKPRPSASEFFGDGNDRFIITTNREWERLRSQLPATATILAECPLFLKKQRLLLIGVPRRNWTLQAEQHPAEGAR